MNKNITIKLSAWIICAVLLISNFITLAIWQPWNGAVGEQKISVTGTSTIEAEADQFVFSPYYQKTGTDREKVNSELGKLSATIVAKLKQLGVSDSSIRTDVGSYGPVYEIGVVDDSDSVSSSLSITITIKDKALAQKVQDYLATTSAEGSISPQITFSTAKQKELESQARELALKDARTKAETSAKQLGSTLGKVISVSDTSSSNQTPLPWILSGSTDSSESSTKDSTSSTYTIQPGLNEYSFSIDVTYELR